MKKYLKPNLINLLLLIVLVVSCKKDNTLSTGIYSEAPGIPVVFNGKYPNPRDAKTGDIVTYEVKGLKSVGQFQFFINQIETEVLNFTDSIITVKVPEGVSSGPATVVTTSGQVFFGPRLNIEGKLAVDPDFEAGIGTNGPIYDLFTNPLTGEHIMVGRFTDYRALATATSRIDGIVKINSNGVRVAYSAGKGLNGGEARTLLPINTANSQFLLGGAISMYNIRNIRNIGKIYSNAALDTVTVNLINPDPSKPQNNADTVSGINGGVLGSVVKLFRDPSGNKSIAIGNFTSYIRNYYTRAQKGIIPIDMTLMNNFVRFDDEGVMDSSYNFNPATGRSYEGLNGFVSGGIQTNSGKIIIIGNFSRFRGSVANRIAALSTTGGPDHVFATNIGSGPNGNVGKITYNKTTGKILLTGTFTQFNDFPANGIVMLNEDGTIDKSFNIRIFEGGFPDFAGQLNNGKIIVAGNFQKYDGRYRLGFMILNSDGSLAEGYNNTGSFSGIINGFTEKTNSRGEHAILLYGWFSVFDNTNVGNLVQITIKN